MHRPSFSFCRILLPAVFWTVALGGCMPAPFHPTRGDLAQGRFSNHPTGPVDSLIVVSYNIQYGEHLDQAELDLRGDPMTSRADFILLQEMDPEGTRRLAESLGYDFVYYPGSIHPKHHRLFGDAILSRWPLFAPDLVLLPHHGFLAGTQRIMTVACADVAGDTVMVASIHTATIVTPHDQRRSQVATAIERVENRRWPVIVGGDFNTAVPNDVAELRDRFRRAGFSQARLPKGPTIRKKKEFFIAGHPALDHIFFRGFTVGSTGVVRNARASDHYPIWAVLRFSRDPH